MNNFDDLLNNAPAEQNSAQLSKEDFAAKKQAEREAVFEMSDNTALEVAGDGDMFRQYLDVQSVFDRYSAVNALLIMAQNPEATRVAEFDTWKSKGGYIKSGETAISILEPHEYTKEDGTAGVGYNIKKVFDVSQVDIRKVKPAPTPPSYTERQLLQALISKAPMKISRIENLSGDLFGRIYQPRHGRNFCLKGHGVSRHVPQRRAGALLRGGTANRRQYGRPHVYCVQRRVHSLQKIRCGRRGLQFQGRARNVQRI